MMPPAPLCRHRSSLFCVVLGVAALCGCESEGHSQVPGDPGQATDTAQQTDSSSPSPDAPPPDDGSSPADGWGVDSAAGPDADAPDTRVEPTALALLCQQRSYGVRGLQHGLGDPPEHLQQEPAVRLPDDWDPAAYFGVLTQLAMEPGYVLDWVYLFTGLGGAPRLYARKAEDPAFATGLALETDGSDDNEWAPHVLSSDTTHGYLEFALLRLVGEQFYRFWHDWQDRHVVCTPDAVAAALVGFEQAWAQTLSESERAQVAALDAEPSVELGEGEATVSLLTFTTSVGSFQRWTLTLHRTHPHHVEIVAHDDVLSVGWTGTP